MTSELLQDLNCRGLIAQSTHPQLLAETLQSPLAVYCGFDPTAGSLHIGHLVPLLMLKRFQDAGHRAIALVGGATGMIGDPSFKAAERSLNESSTVAQWVADLSGQIERLMTPHLDTPLTLVNNADWLGPLDVITFFREVGKHFSVNAMVNKESVRQRLARPDQGISFTEFSYSLLQAYDFTQLNQRFGCRLQIGGNDQWGNIVSGIDLTRRLNQAQVFGLTLPLITKSDGTKFGKTESGAIWLDAEKTSPYAFYQFWLNTADADVYRFLRYYTFLSCEQIEAIETADRAGSGKPQAQRVLAEALTCFVHGKAGLLSAQRITRALFGGEGHTSGHVHSLTLAELDQLALDGLPCTAIKIDQDTPLDVPQLLMTVELASSKRVARELITSGAVRINGERIADEVISPGLALFERYLVLQRGKKQFHLFRLQGPCNQV
ncbi:tyrosine--tRNA ligase [Photobacterium sp. TY1-4]|uniref:tyrosine--tRNA ligase n=1 Tax=Photobacterium sp. TY1-4 TaxID=2899122 RepID=UPI0021C1BCE1|nr:tyrosine--tRNA ligase [Photobacterium sp. TY1-4]UXI02032.1 tyrosine--tRNA ligase [Photobacterium sp. TY1-4]